MGRLCFRLDYGQTHKFCPWSEGVQTAWFWRGGGPPAGFIPALVIYGFCRLVYIPDTGTPFHRKWSETTLATVKIAHNDVYHCENGQKRRLPLRELSITRSTTVKIVHNDVNHCENGQKRRLPLRKLSITRSTTAKMVRNDAHRCENCPKRRSPLRKLSWEEKKRLLQ